MLFVEFNHATAFQQTLLHGGQVKIERLRGKRRGTRKREVDVREREHDVRGQ